MTQALFTSMTGLNAGTEQLTVVSDNVANMNTTAYKTSRVDFQDVWYQTKTTGTNSTVVSGGTNPYQVGVGVKCASITKDFSASSVNTTGRTEDMAIQGEGWFTIVNSDGAVLLTRDGTFSLDEEGYLVTANGSRVLGMDEMVSDTRSDIPIKFPTSIKVVETPTPIAKFEEMFVGNLNNAEFTDGYFYATHTAADGITKTKLKIQVSDDTNRTNEVNSSTVKTLVNTLNAGTNTNKLQYWDTVDEEWKDVAITTDPLTGEKTNPYFKASVENGTIKFTLDDPDSAMFFETGGTSNFVTQTKLASMTKQNGAYTTDVLNMSASIAGVDDITADTTKNYKSFSVGIDGLVTVTYGDSSTLSVKANGDGTTYFSYTTAEGIIIDDDIQNTGDASLWVDPNVLIKANMQMQFAKVVNNGGLVAEGNNQYSIGVNAGRVIYTASNVNGVGGLTTGALEASNVDLAQQFSNMILAQRLVQANSQVFSGANQLLETLVYLGQ